MHEGQVVEVCKYIHHTIVLEQVLERTEHTVRRDTVAPGVQTLPREPRVRTQSPSLYSQSYGAESQDHPLLKVVRETPGHDNKADVVLKKGQSLGDLPAFLKDVQEGCKARA